MEVFSDLPDARRGAKARSHTQTIERGHGRWERCSVSYVANARGVARQSRVEWASLQGIIRVTHDRHRLKGGYILIRLPK